MITGHQNKLHIEDVQEVTFVLGYFYLLYEGLEEDLDGDGGEFCEDWADVAQDELAQCLLLVVLHEEEG